MYLTHFHGFVSTAHQTRSTRYYEYLSLVMQSHIDFLISCDSQEMSSVQCKIHVLINMWCDCTSNENLIVIETFEFVCIYSTVLLYNTIT